MVGTGAMMCGCGLRNELYSLQHSQSRNICSDANGWFDHPRRKWVRRLGLAVAYTSKSLLVSFLLIGTLLPRAPTC
jgi:hypothetical protein